MGTVLCPFCALCVYMPRSLFAPHSYCDDCVKPALPRAETGTCRKTELHETRETTPSPAKKSQTPSNPSGIVAPVNTPQLSRRLAGPLPRTRSSSTAVRGSVIALHATPRTHGCSTKNNPPVWSDVTLLCHYWIDAQPWCLGTASAMPTSTSRSPSSSRRVPHAARNSPPRSAL